jgi:hypothetical protein
VDEAMFNLGLEAAFNGDVETNKSRACFGSSLPDEPVGTLTQEGMNENEATLGPSSNALPDRFFPDTAIGVPVVRGTTPRSDETHSPAMRSRSGPTMYIPITCEMFCGLRLELASCGQEVAAGSLDHTEFSRSRPRIKTSIEF